MPSQVRVIFNNLPELAAALGTNGDAIVGATAEAIANDARSMVHVDTGDLQGSIQASQVGRCHWQVNTGSMREAWYQEYGGRGGPHPYMVPAAHQAEPGFIDAMAGIITP